MAGPRCPVCREAIERGVETFPFCSRRCRTIDLGDWLGESYRVADAPAPEAEGALLQRLLGSEDEWPSA